MKMPRIALIAATLLASPSIAGERPLPEKEPCNPRPESNHLPVCVRPKMRYWLALDQLDEQAVRHDIARIAEAGFGSVEINSIPGESASTPEQAYGGVKWKSVLRAALSEARKHHITIDLAIGPLYPAAVPQAKIGKAASRELIFVAVPVEARFEGQIPQPKGGHDSELVAVSAVRVAGTDGTTTTFDRASLIDLTTSITDGNLNWTPPSPGNWRIVASWSRTTGHQIIGAAPTPYTVVDHFSLDATDKIIRHWQDEILPNLGANRAILSDVFEDSLHLQGYALWTPDFLTEFKRRRGYDLRPFLPVVSIGHLNDFFFSISSGHSVTVRSKPDYDFSDGSGTKIRDDYYQTLTELYSERHLALLRRFFASNGLRLRAQTSYGQSLEGTAPVANVDVPETESFQLDNLVEAYKVQAGAVHVLGKPIYSAECCAQSGLTGKTDWSDANTHISGLFAGGVNQIVYHGFAQTTPHKPGQAGWKPFGGMFSEDYGTIAAWPEARKVTSYVARQQALLRAGQPDLDLAILRHSYWDNGHAKVSPGFDYLADSNLGSAGYTHDYVSPWLLSTRQWLPRGGVAAPRGPAYRAIVVMPGQALPVSALQRLLASARLGLPIVFVGSLPKPLGMKVDRSAFAGILARLIAAPKVLSVKQLADAPNALITLGIYPKVKTEGPSGLNLIVRRLPTERYIWLHNPTDSEMTQRLHTAARTLEEIDLQRGGRQTTPYRKDGGGISWQVTLNPQQSRGFWLLN